MKNCVKLLWKKPFRCVAYSYAFLGKLKKGDIPASVRDQAIRVMVDKYFFDQKKVVVSGYGFDMLYAGPKEAFASCDNKTKLWLLVFNHW